MNTEKKAKAIDIVKQMIVDGQVSQEVAEKYFPELKQDGDERIRKELLNHCKDKAEKYSNDPKYKNISAWIAWLEKQGKQKPTEWSKEDEEMFDYTLSMIEWYVGVDEDKLKPVSIWLKSLKGKFTWKPSKEQIMALRWVLNHIPYDSHKEEISGLLDQIKDL